MIYQRQKIKHFSYFYYTIFLAAPKDIRLNFTHCFIMKIPNKRELKQTASQIHQILNFQDVVNLYKKCAVKPYSFLVIGNTLASDNPSRFRKNLLETI